MSAIVIILPIPTVDPLADEDLHEQQIQEQIRLIANRDRVPPRTRPVLAIDNKRRGE